MITLADAHGSERSHDREGVVAGKRTTSPSGTLAAAFQAD
jgi:hypothetical protein